MSQWFIRVRPRSSPARLPGGEPAAIQLLPEHRPPQAEPGDPARPDFSQVAVQGAPASARVNQPGDPFEQEAERTAGAVLRGSAGPAREGEQAQPAVGGPGGGEPLPETVRNYMEPRFGADFSQVRVHTDRQAARSSQYLGASAYTHLNHIYFGADRAPGNDALTAHELTHILQQRQAGPGAVPAVQRTLEVRPPGRGEASAFDRRQELIDRLNTINPAIQYRLEGRIIHYDVVDENALTLFDRRMMGFIDQAELIPMRLITRAGRVSDGGGGFVPLRADSFIAGYVDLDDMLADDIHAFQLTLVHFLTERSRVRGYARRIGTNFGALFAAAHRAGRDAEGELLQDMLNDPSIRYNYEEQRGTNYVIAWKSHDHNYRVFRVIRRMGQELTPADVFVRTSDGRRFTLDEFIAQRAAPVAP